MPVFEHTEIQLHYERSGDGPPLLLIAGMMSDSASWAPLIPLLEPHFDVIRPDNRTTGRTTPWDAPVCIDRVASDCAALLSHLGTGPAHVMGHSLGGMIGMRLAKHHAGAVKTLTLAASAPLRLEWNVALLNRLLSHLWPIPLYNQWRQWHSRLKALMNIYQTQFQIWDALCRRFWEK